MQKRTILLFDGGHKSLIEGLGVQELERAVTECRDSEHELNYLQGTQFGDNGYVLDAKKVVAIIAARGREGL